jgi:hypothetical protein
MKFESKTSAFKIENKCSNSNEHCHIISLKDIYKKYLSDEKIIFFQIFFKECFIVNCSNVISFVVGSVEFEPKIPALY